MKTGEIACGNTCTYDYPLGVSVILTASAEHEANFFTWMANGCTNNPTCALAITGSETIVVYFTGATVATGGYHSLALKYADHTVWAWGDNADGALGNGTQGVSVIPQPIPNLNLTQKFFAKDKGPFTLKLLKKGNGIGTVAGEGQYITGASVRLTATPALGSKFEGWSPTPCAASFSMPAKALACAATFTLKTYTVTPLAGRGGTINPSAPRTVKYNATITFVINPTSGHVIDKVTGCNGTLTGKVYKTGPITANFMVKASFKLKTYMVTVVVGANRIASPNVAQTVQCLFEQESFVYPHLQHKR